MKSRDHIRFPPRPIDVIGCAARQCAEKQRLPESPHVDHQRSASRKRQIPEPATQLPRRFFVEHREL